MRRLLVGVRPADGDEVWQIAPGTASIELPSHWRCPNCDAEQHQFMVRPGSAGAPAEAPARKIAEQRCAEGPTCVADSMRACRSTTGAGCRIVGMALLHSLLAVVVTPW